MTRPDGVTHFFDNLGFLTRTEDRNGNTLTYIYERVNAFDGVACAATDVIGQLIDGPSLRLCTRRLTEVVDPDGRVADRSSTRKAGSWTTPLDRLAAAASARPRPARSAAAAGSSRSPTTPAASTASSTTTTATW